MTAELAAACGELIGWLPAAAVLVAEPDQDGTGGQVTRPSSSPPWNAQAANAVFDIHEGVRRLEQAVRLLAAGHEGARRGGSDAATVAALRAVASLGHALERQDAAAAGRLVERWITMILQLPAIDEAPVWDRIPAPCPYCGTRWLYAARRSGEVRCAFADCRDLDGNPFPRARPEWDERGRFLRWADGTVLAAP
jgi:hypothetical protein